MIGVLRSELFKMRTTRATKIVVACAIVVPMAINILTSIFGFNNGNVGDSVLANVGLATPLVGLLIGVVGVLCSTQEYSQGTIRITLVATPKRIKVWIAKILTVIIISVGSTLILITTCLVPMKFILEQRNITFELIAPDIRVIPSMVLLVSLLSILGLSLGLIFKSSPGAISALVLWPTIIEGLVFGLLSIILDKDVFRWAPIQNGFQLVSIFQSSDSNSWPISLAYFSGFVMVFCLIGGVLFSRRDA
jgi:ABC-2 type transport system permease protein